MPQQEDEVVWRSWTEEPEINFQCRVEGTSLTSMERDALANLVSSIAEH
jgi:hypothetical protein